MVMILIASAAAFAYMLTSYHQVPNRMIEFMSGISENPIAILSDDQRDACWSSA